MKEQIEQVQNYFRYCNSLTSYSRYKTRVVNIGDIAMGGDNPLRIQSMTTTDTMNTIATVEQTIRMVEAGCEYVRITAPSINEAKNLQNIKEELKKRGYTVPLIADIHFTPNAAEMAARIVEKVRVNPGNYVDKKKFELIEYTDAEYNEELERIYDRFIPLVKICKEYGTAMRVGTNHGSLSDRIMSRYGDTPLGMVESALEFLRICNGENYHNVVVSMKASNPQVMVQAYRLLVNRMEAENMNYPLHLGVTEAGDGEDGRVKSAMGIGALLEDGLGDTIRVSLTEEPEFEAPVAIALAERYKQRPGHADIIAVETVPGNPFEYSKRQSIELIGIGGANVPRVIADMSKEPPTEPNDLNAIGYFYNAETDKWYMNDTAADFIYLGSATLPFDIPNGLRAIVDAEKYKDFTLPNYYPLFSADSYSGQSQSLFNFVSVKCHNLTDTFLKALKEDPTTIIILSSDNVHAMPDLRNACFRLVNSGVPNPLILQREFIHENKELSLLYSSTDFGSLFIDGFGDGMWFSSPSLNIQDANRVAFGILQAARVRISKTEYIACPSCGRTLFDLVETTDKIRKRTEHLKGVKIAIMGCIVNGPGEMADADYGYVGSGIGKITLYRGKEIVKRAIPSEDAVDELIELIREDGQWVEPVAVS